MEYKEIKFSMLLAVLLLVFSNGLQLTITKRSVKENSNSNLTKAITYSLQFHNTEKIQDAAIKKQKSNGVIFR